MSALLSADDLNDFISPGVACIKPIEQLPPSAQPDSASNYEVTTEERAAAAEPTPAQISLTDCLACSGCVTSAEAVLVSLQSSAEVLDALDRLPAHALDSPSCHRSDPVSGGRPETGTVFVASVSPQTTASLAAAYGVTPFEAAAMVEQLLAGPDGLRAGGRNKTGFSWVIDTSWMRDVGLVVATDELVGQTGAGTVEKPVLTSACPGWICYVEKTHPELLPHLSAVKSAQSLTGTVVKSTLWRRCAIPPDRVWHLAVMPCFDKKLEASRSELTSAAWLPDPSVLSSSTPARDVDCVITPRELIALAEARGIDFGTLPRHHLARRVPFPDARIDSFFFPTANSDRTNPMTADHGTSGGFLTHIAKRIALAHPDSQIRVTQGRNSDVLDLVVESRPNTTVPTPGSSSRPAVHFRAARYYGFRNIQNLVRKLKPGGTTGPGRSSRLLAAAQASKNMTGVRKAPTPPSSTPSQQGPSRKTVGGTMAQYGYVEVMACPGGCSNGGGQLGLKDLESLNLRLMPLPDDDSGNETSTGQDVRSRKMPSPREWLAEVDAAYRSIPTDQSSKRPNGETNQAESDDVVVDGISYNSMRGFVEYWANMVECPVDQLVKTTYRDVSASDILSSGVASKGSVGDDDIVAGLAAKIGSGW